MTRQGSRCFLLVRSQEWMCALPLDEVEETMRPLPVSSVASAPDYVRGVCLVRGTTAPVVSLARLLGGGTPPPGQRFVSLRVPEGRVALEVDEVRGLRWLDAQTLDSVPPLLRSSAGAQLHHLGSVDGNLMAILATTHLLPQGLWSQLQNPAGEGRS